RRHTRFSRDWSSDVCSSDLLSDAEIARRFNYHAPGDDVQKTMVRLRHAYTTLARTVAEELEPGREASLAFTELEISMFYAIGALAPNPAAPGGEPPFDLPPPE